MTNRNAPAGTSTPIKAQERAINGQTAVTSKQTQSTMIRGNVNAA